MLKWNIKFLILAGIEVVLGTQSGEYPESRTLEVTQWKELVTAQRNYWSANCKHYWFYQKVACLG